MSVGYVEPMEEVFQSTISKIRMIDIFLEACK